MSNIARRTRSHLSIDDDVVNHDGLDFPDVDASLYQNPSSVNDHEYKDFLEKCFSEAVELETDTNTDDNDPAYVYNNDIFSHGWKYNVFEGLPQQQQQQQQQHHQQQQQQEQLHHQLQHQTPHGENKFGPEFARILDQQLRQHIQLLTQSYLLTRCLKQTQDEADELKEHLNNYNRIFHDRRKPANLLPAIQLVNQFGIPKELGSSIRLSWRHLPVPESVKISIERNRDVFPYADLLPRVAFSQMPVKLVKKRAKSEFTLNEDKLLAVALDEFKGETRQYAYIASLLLPAKTKTQIVDHIKNVRRKYNIALNNPIRIYFDEGRLPDVDLDSSNRLREDHAPLALQQEPELVDTCNMDDLMTASTTISKNNINEKSLKSLKIRKTVVDLLPHKFAMSEEMGELIVDNFLKASKEALSQRNHLKLLQLLAESKKYEDPGEIFEEISRFLKIAAPLELQEHFVLFLNMETATKCNRGPSYLHWLRALQFIDLTLLYHESEGIEKKLGRLVDAIRKGDVQKMSSAAANLINKNPLLKREYEALALDGKPHPSLFIHREDFDDQTEPFASDDPSHFEHFEHGLTTGEINYASQMCPCKCHQKSEQHCERCHLKLMRGRMYLVNKKKPCLAEWAYTERQPEPPAQPLEWTFEEDKKILEFCQAKSRESDESLSFDTPIFEGLVRGKSAAQIAERFNYLYRRMMEMCVATD